MMNANDDKTTDMSSKIKHIVLSTAVNVSRMIMAATLLFSGFVKANDPMGTVFKLQDYMSAWGMTSMPEVVMLIAALFMVLIEFGLGVYLLFGMRRRIVSVVTLLFMTLMTLLTVYIAIYNPVSDCGCFGDAIILTNTQTLLKNILLLACAFMVFRWYKLQMPLISRQIYWIVSTLAMLAIISFAVYCIYSQPFIDFRPYKIGSDLRQKATVPASQRPQFEVTIIYERNGETLELGIDDDDPDDSWTYVETRRKQLKQADIDIINDFYMQDADGEDLATDILEADGYTLLLTAPDLLSADQSIMGLINDIYDYASEAGVNFVALTPSTEEARSRWIDYTGAEYSFLTADERTLKTMVRGNPGLMLLHDGVVKAKWSNWNFPTTEQLTEIITK